MLARINPRSVAAAVAVLLVIAVLLMFTGKSETKTVTAHFDRAVSIFEGTDVRVLGVNVGKVTAVVPEGNSVRVVMEYDGDVDLPVDAKALIITPTLVADRFIELTPVHTGGEVLPSGAELALEDNGVPVELDRIYAGLRDLTETLGPNGVNSDGTLDHLLTVAQEHLVGKGQQGNQTIRDLSEAAAVFGNNSGDLFETVTNLAEFTETLALNDELVVAFMQDLAGVSRDLADEREELEAAVVALAGAVGTVETFVKENREALTTDIEKLTRVIKNIASEKDNLDLALTAGPVGIGNLVLAFDDKSGSIGSRFGFQGNVADADGFICAVVQQSELPQAAKDLTCTILEAALEPILSQANQNLPIAGPASDDPASGPHMASGYASSGPATLDQLLGGR
ncbi:MCE family protein [Nocardioides sp. AE5]|uniref:MCE family protein n=1 Tax=Nocardioides sp. AE5 TaxID=2962573 RepID=UPI0028828E46|nr:MCE family protein [Nocardioides sp. AE5]MDT0201425.1 MCE family protein [Nocardioides sp. AE5]